MTFNKLSSIVPIIKKVGDLFVEGIVISIVNNKGGVGKTTVACNLGAALSKLKMRVLIIDMDPQCNTTGILLHDTVIRNSLYELLDYKQSDNIVVDSCIYLSKQQGLYCLPNVEETAGLELDLISRYPASLSLVREKVRDYVKQNFDFTIIDNPPNMGLFVVNSLYASDFVIVPNDAGSSYSLDGLRKALDLIDSVKESGESSLRFLRLLINRVDLRTAISRVILEDIKSRFKANQVFKTIIPISTILQQAEYSRQTIFQKYQNSRAAQAYRQLAKELITILGVKEQSPNKTEKI